MSAKQSSVRTLGELAQLTCGKLIGDPDMVIQGVSSLEDADEGDIIFAESPSYLMKAKASHASAVVTPRDSAIQLKSCIEVDNPRLAFSLILQSFTPLINRPTGIHPGAVVANSASIGIDVSVGPGVVIGENTVIGNGTILHAGVIIGDNCTVGCNCILYPHATLYNGVLLGQRVILHAGSVIGADGFGYLQIGGVSHKIPHIGTVEIGDDVEVGANSTIDRAKTGATTIGARTKIDNFVQIAHNCKVGEDCIIVAQVGIAGSCHIGRGVVLAAQSGVKDHVRIGDGAMILARAGALKTIQPGEVVSGFPARPHRQKLRQDAALEFLPEYIKRIRALEKANEKLLVMLEMREARE